MFIVFIVKYNQIMSIIQTTKRSRRTQAVRATGLDNISVGHIWLSLEKNPTDMYMIGIQTVTLSFAA